MPALHSVSGPLTKLFLLIALMLAGIAFAGAQAIAQVSGPEKPVAGSTPGGVTSGSSSDSQLWRQIRKGQQGTVVGGDKSGGLMIQSGGQDWRLLRDGPLPRYSAWAILGTLLLLSLFFALRGRIRIGSGRSGDTIKRFSIIERAGHWLLASSFIILALTGLNLIFGKTLLIPLLGKGAFASLTVFGKYIHNYVAFAFMLGLVMIVVMWVVHNIPNRHDIMWLLRGGGILGGAHPPARKFNAGQKIIFWVVVLCGISISLSGWALMNPFTTQMFSGTFELSNSLFGTSYATNLNPIQEQQYQSLWHTIMAVFMIVVILAHIYIGSVGMEGALDAMTSGDVDKNWAREHHSLWVEEVQAGLSGSASTAPQAVGAAAKVSAPKEVATDPVVRSRVPSPSASPSPKDATARPDTSSSTTKSAGGSLGAAKEKPKPQPQPKTRASSARSSTAPKKKPKTTAAQKTKTAAKPRSKAAPSSKRSSRSSARDDLKLIKGIGPQNEKRLNAIKVTRFEHVAAWSKKEQADIGLRLAFPGRIEREEWVKQAKILAKKAAKD